MRHWTIALLALLSPGFSHADVAPYCFDFSEQITKPLMRPPELKPGSILSQEGIRKGDQVEFAGARAIIQRPIKEIYEWLLDHTNWKDMNKTKLKVLESHKAGYTAFHTVDVDVNVWAFINLQWVEQWAYALDEGTEKNPKRYQISYQKLSGTGHIKRLCGSITLKDAGKNKTDAYFYEEALADRYHWQNMLEMHQNNIRRLNTKNDASAKASKE